MGERNNENGGPTSSQEGLVAIGEERSLMFDVLLRMSSFWNPYGSTSSLYMENGGRTFSEEEEMEPPQPLPVFLEEWLTKFSGWSVEHKIMALDGLIPLYVVCACLNL